MSAAANPLRGEVAFQGHVLRPSFAALVAAEAELGPLLALVDRATEGRIALSEIATLFWHCLAERDVLDRAAMGEAVVTAGLAAATPVLRAILHQILAGTS
ncbi:MAG TPA: GTA-gp10 family protein [Sphingobium sp.]|nr:GTA-gp10 family protein [Sphingobium sp.]